MSCASITSMLPAAPALLRPTRGAYTGSLHAPPAMATSLSASSDGGSNGGVIQIFEGGATPTVTPAAVVPTAAGSYDFAPGGDVNGDGYDDVVIVLAGTAAYLYEGAAQLPTTFAATWANTMASGAIGGFDIDGDHLADIAVGDAMIGPPILYRGTAAGPTAVAMGLANLNASAIMGFSDHDGDGRPDIFGSSGPQSSGASIEWAGSDGTTNPRAFELRLSDASAHFNGLLVR